MIYENEFCYFLRKPHKIASSRGREQSFLDIITNQLLKKTPLKLTAPPKFCEKLSSEIGVTKSDLSFQQRTLLTQNFFGKKNEYGLLNRLDTETAGFLYFAKTKDIYDNRKDRQASKQITKYYLCKINNAKEIKTPKNIRTRIAHHRNGKKMIFASEELLKSKRKQKIKGKLLQAETSILSHHQFDKNTYTIVSIKKGWRHQIRAHFQGIGFPLQGDVLYGGESNEFLQLRSLGCVLEK